MKDELVSLCDGLWWPLRCPRASRCLPCAQHCPVNLSPHGSHLFLTCSPFDAVSAASDFLLLWPPAWVPASGPGFESYTFLFSVLTLMCASSLEPGFPCRSSPDLAPAGASCSCPGHLWSPTLSSRGWLQESLPQPWPPGPWKLDTAVELIYFSATGIGRQTHARALHAVSTACNYSNCCAWGWESHLVTDVAPGSTCHTGLKRCFKFCL